MRVGEYGRVSSREQIEGYSIEAQKRAVAGLITARGWTLVGSYYDEGRSAYRESLARPQLQQLLQDMRAGAFDVIVVHKLDRFSRRAGLTFNLIDELHGRGIAFVSVQENFDLTTPFGWAMFQQAGIWAEFFSRNLSFEVSKGLREKWEEDGWIGRIPLGYNRRAEDGILVPNAEAETVVVAHDLYATGRYSLATLADELNRRGYRSRNRQRQPVPFTWEPLRTLVGNRVYLGYVKYKGEERRGIHPPLITEAVWAEVTRVRAQHASWYGSRIRGDGDGFVLHGMTWCAACAHKCHIHRARAEHQYYVCFGSGRHVCTERRTRAGLADAQIMLWLRRLVLPSDVRSEVVAEIRRAVRSSNDAAPRTTPQQLAQRLDRLKRLYLDNMLDDQAYHAERAAIIALQEDLRAATAGNDTQIDREQRAIAMLDRLAQQLQHTSETERRAVLQALVDRVWLKDRRIYAVTARAEVYPLLQMMERWSMRTLT